MAGPRHLFFKTFRWFWCVGRVEPLGWGIWQEWWGDREKGQKKNVRLEENQRPEASRLDGLGGLWWETARPWGSLHTVGFIQQETGSQFREETICGDPHFKWPTTRISYVICRTPWGEKNAGLLVQKLSRVSRWPEQSLNLSTAPFWEEPRVTAQVTSLWSTQSWEGDQP